MAGGRCAAAKGLHSAAVARPDIVVVGGGIAGLASAWQLAERGARVLLLEQEPLLATHSTARNAAIWLPTDAHGTSPALTRRSAELLDELLGREGWLRVTGAVVTAEDPALLGDDAEGARRSGADAIAIDALEAVRLAPALAGGSARAALHVPGAGVLDIHAMNDALVRAARRAGVSVRTSARVRSLVRDGGRVAGVQLADGTRIDAEWVVVAAGAWVARLGAGCGAPVPAVPLRRHLVVLDVAGAEREPIVWHTGPEVYYRPESGGLLASPCDEVAWDPCLPVTDAQQLEVLARRLTALAPVFEGARVRRSWACLRTYTPDREMVAGPDPRAPGLAWLAGLGGRGMTVGVAAGELTAALVAGDEHPLAAEVSPVRPALG